MIADKDFQYIGIDDDGIRYNKAYPPDKKKYGNNYGGYANNAREVLLYDLQYKATTCRSDTTESHIICYMNPTTRLSVTTSIQRNTSLMTILWI